MLTACWTAVEQPGFWHNLSKIFRKLMFDDICGLSCFTHDTHIYNTHTTYTSTRTTHTSILWIEIAVNRDYCCIPLLPWVVFLTPICRHFTGVCITYSYAPCVHHVFASLCSNAFVNYVDMMHCRGASSLLWVTLASDSAWSGRNSFCSPDALLMPHFVKIILKSTDF